MFAVFAPVSLAVYDSLKSIGTAITARQPHLFIAASPEIARLQVFVLLVVPFHGYRARGKGIWKTFVASTRADHAVWNTIRAPRISIFDAFDAIADPLFSVVATYVARKYGHLIGKHPKIGRSLPAVLFVIPLDRHRMRCKAFGRAIIAPTRNDLAQAITATFSYNIVNRLAKQMPTVAAHIVCFYA